MKQEKIFDMVSHMRDGGDYKLRNDSTGETITLTPGDQREAFQRFLSGYVHGAVSQIPVTNSYGETSRVEIRAFSGSSDLPELTKDVFSNAAQTPYYDMGWSDSFMTVPLMQGQLSWEIATTKSGEAFQLIPEGDPVILSSVSGSKVTASIRKYGAGLAITWEMIEGRRLYQFIQSLESMRANLYKVWADTHYGLLATAATGNPVAYGKGTSQTSELAKDIATLNSAYIDIAEAVADSGYGDVSSVPMRLYAHPKLAPRINAALRLTNSDVSRGGSGTGTQVEFPIQFSKTLTSKMPNSGDSALLVLPGNRIQNAIYMRELGLQKQDNMTLSDIQTYWTAFGGIVADTKQVAEVKFK